MEITWIPKDYIIKATRKMELEQKNETDFFVRAVKIKNTTNETIKIQSYTFDLIYEGQSQKKIIYVEHLVKVKSAELYQLGERFLKERTNETEKFRKHNLYTILGKQAPFWNNDRLSKENTLKPQEETGFLSEHIRLATKENKSIDNLILTVNYEINEESNEVQSSIPIISYKNKGKYILPLKGVYQIFCNWDSVDSHRGAYSQEFAIDFAFFDFDDIEKLIGKQPNENYPSYGENILAIADGEVIEYFDGIPDNPTSITTMTKEQIMDLATKHGVTPVSAGNYVIIDHKNDEYSFYAHMIPGSVKVKTGDRVKQGQTLGHLGNSGNSDGPHLHFQLMNGPDKPTSRGLPCSFINVYDLFDKQVPFIDRSRSIIVTKEKIS
ncbi:MAG: M23 family metallopeptidase [Candidatus Hodarchaeales archaeon]|jgi:hypothetical protein